MSHLLYSISTDLMCYCNYFSKVRPKSGLEREVQFAENPLQAYYKSDAFRCTPEALGIKTACTLT